ncbi:MAG: polysaccharide biosynthesis tyrosine autokinase [Sedimentisphaerales bacterium]|nr:polysaccharide biosynthesis tyrosine autokinase [Sedimentisphaerales bacterium]
MAEGKPMTSNKLTTPAMLRSSEASSLTAKEVLGILRRHVLLIIILTILGLFAGGGIWKLLQKYSPKYTATTYIQVLSPVPTDPMTIGTAQLQKDILYNHRQSIANLIKQQSTLQDLVALDDVKRTDWFRRRDNNVRKAVKYLNQHFNAYAHRDSEFVEISMTCRDAKEAADIVNKMLDLFLKSRGSAERGEVGQRLKELEEQKTDVERELRAAETSLNDVRQASGISDLEMPVGRNFQHTITLTLNSLELQKTELDLVIKQLGADIQNLERLAEDPMNDQIEFAIEQDPVMIVLAQQLVFQEAELRGLLTRFGENHREVLQIRQSIEEIQKKRELRKNEIAEQTSKANLKNARDSLIVLQQRFEELENLRLAAEAKKRDLDEARIQYGQRLKIRDERVEMLDKIKEQIEKWKMIAKDPETPKVQSVGDAPRPLEMVFSRQWWLWLPSGWMLGLLCGIGLAFLIELANDLVKTPSDIAKYVRIPLLAVIPDSSEDNQVRGLDLCHIVRKAPYSIISESYRRCRTNLKLSGSTESTKTLLVTSGMAEDGKTSTAVNLATTFVAAGKKVLLIDGNFRQPNLHILFPKIRSAGSGAVGFDFGLSSVLMNQCTSKEAVRSSEIEGLDLIDCGPIPANPAELLSSERMEELLREQRKKYDNIIIDSPPVLLVSDATILAGFVDATIVIFNASATSRGAAQRTVRELRDVDANIVGCVLFAARAIKGGYFHEQFKSYRKYQKAQLARR